MNKKSVIVLALAIVVACVAGQPVSAAHKHHRVAASHKSHRLVPPHRKFLMARSRTKAQAVVVTFPGGTTGHPRGFQKTRHMGGIGH